MKVLVCGSEESCMLEIDMQGTSAGGGESGLPGKHVQWENRPGFLKLAKEEIRKEIDQDGVAER